MDQVTSFEKVKMNYKRQSIADLSRARNIQYYV